VTTDPGVARPATTVFVTGTATEVGKTWWCAAVARYLRVDGIPVTTRKPVQSGEPGAPTDADALAAATGDDPALVCPPRRTYSLAWAPPFAAAELGAPPFTIADLVAELVWPHGVLVGLVEGAGGPRSPIADDGDNVDLVRALAPDVVVLVADAGLGTINATRLAAAAFAELDLPLVVALNRFDDSRLHRRNREHLAEHAGFDVVTDPIELSRRLRSRGVDAS
jgi:dethiobiotin synthase